jgi:hypothetical protein
VPRAVKARLNLLTDARTDSCIDRAVTKPEAATSLFTRCPSRRLSIRGDVLLKQGGARGEEAASPICSLGTGEARLSTDDGVPSRLFASTNSESPPVSPEEQLESDAVGDDGPSPAADDFDSSSPKKQSRGRGTRVDSGSENVKSNGGTVTVSFGPHSAEDVDSAAADKGAKTVSPPKRSLPESVEGSLASCSRYCSGVRPGGMVQNEGDTPVEPGPSAGDSAEMGSASTGGVTRVGVVGTRGGRLLAASDERRSVCRLAVSRETGSGLAVPKLGAKVTLLGFA